MGEEKAILKLAPSNWFYNLSVYGFLRVLNDECKINLEKEGVFKEDGSVEIDLDNYGLFKETDFISDKVKSVRLWDCLINQFIKYFIKQEQSKKKPNEEELKKLKNLLKSSTPIKERYEGIRGKVFYHLKNLFNPSPNGDDFKYRIDFWFFSLLPTFLKWAKKKKDIVVKCQFCGNYPLLDSFEKDKFKDSNDEGESKAKLNAFERLRFLTSSHIENLGPSLNKFPNSFWNLESSVPLCLVCNILFLFYLLGLIDIGNNKKIFINTPSFKLIWKLNRHLEKIHSKESTEDIKTLFGSSFINLVLDLNVKLGLWQRFSTEVIVFHNNNIDFYEIPPQIIELLEDKEIGKILIKLNNFKILKLIMSGNFKFLEILISRFLRGLYNKSIKDDELLREFNLNRFNPQTGVLLAKLYALIVDKLKKPSEVLI
jgi:CRISPR-associated protein Cst1